MECMLCAAALKFNRAGLGKNQLLMNFGSNCMHSVICNLASCGSVARSQGDCDCSDLSTWVPLCVSIKDSILSKGKQGTNRTGNHTVLTQDQSWLTNSTAQMNHQYSCPMVMLRCWFADYLDLYFYSCVGFYLSMLSSR